MTDSPPRYSQRSFPAYAFVPGTHPHPTRDPAGHSYGQALHAAAVALNPNHWERCDDYLFGVDLFNHGYWWEAHEAWEGPWRVAGRRSETGCFLQGLIQVGVGRLKWHQGLCEPARRLAMDGRRKLSLTRGCYAGLDVDCFTDEVEGFFARRSGVQELRIVLPPAMPRSHSGR